MAENLSSVSWLHKKSWEIYQVYPDAIRNGEKPTKCILTPKAMENLQSVSCSLRNGKKSTKCILTP